MQAADAHARRAGTPAAAHASGRTRLDKRAWRDVRRASRTLNADGNLYAAEVHGIKLFFRWPKAHQPTLETSGGKEKEKTGKAGSERTADAQRSTQRPLRPPNSRQRRSANRQQEYVRQWREWCQHNPEAAEAWYGGGRPNIEGARESRDAGAAGQQPKQPPAAEDSGEEDAKGCAHWQWKQHPDGHEIRRLGGSGRIWHVKCTCPVDTWPCQHMADEEARPDDEMSDASGPASDPLTAHYAVHCPADGAGGEQEESAAETGGNGSPSHGKAKANKGRKGGKARRKR